MQDLKAELTEAGVDLTFVKDRVDSLSYLKRALDDGTIDIALEKYAARQAQDDILFGTMPDLIKWREYYGARGITLETLEDIQKIRDYAAELEEEDGDDEEGPSGGAVDTVDDGTKRDSGITPELWNPTTKK